MPPPSGSSPLQHHLTPAWSMELLKFVLQSCSVCALFGLLPAYCRDGKTDHTFQAPNHLSSGCFCTALEVYLYGGQVTSWKNDHGQELLFVSFSTVLGFGINIMTLVMITLLGITKRTAGGTGREARNGYNSPYHDWLCRGSQCLMWVTILLISNCNNWFAILCNQILCLWWVMKPLLGIPFLQTAFSSLEGLVICYL
ncbi:hypothetical protein LOK49_LG14G01672 [Camellia lanceoleosa]|uniref:Uncharacterized protein n=1 Tax=Camellia lanceoleosa TaxID=1840588 RepID=A0ACC0FDU1_9ERIC|nr:hypothetical protein LOK49_LG14G01672 [Camellia lanceoleosa]